MTPPRRRVALPSVRPGTSLPFLAIREIRMTARQPLLDASLQDLTPAFGEALQALLFDRDSSDQRRLGN